MRRLGDHAELWLTTVGLLVILAVPVFWGGDPGSHWPATAQTAIGVGVAHGLIFWCLRARQRRVRREALEDGRNYLSREVQRQVTALLTLGATATPEVQTRLLGVLDSLAILDGVLQSLTEERLQHGAPRPAPVPVELGARVLDYLPN
jgi:hypothetical protein